MGGCEMGTRAPLDPEGSSVFKCLEPSGRILAGQSLESLQTKYLESLALTAFTVQAPLGEFAACFLARRAASSLFLGVKATGISTEQLPLR